MAGESDTLIQSLNNRIQDLTTQVATLSGEAKKRRLELREEQKQHGLLRTAHATLTTAHDAWKVKAEADPVALQVKLDAAEGQLRSRDHRDAWREALGDTLNDKVSVEDVWGKLNYKPADKVPTAAEITEQVKPALAAAPYLFKTGATPKPAPAGATPAKPPLTTAVTPSRGASDTAVRRFEVRKEQLRDPAWMRQNQQNMDEAHKAGMLVFADE